MKSIEIQPEIKFYRLNKFGNSKIVLSLDGKNPVHYVNDRQAFEKYAVLTAMGIKCSVYKPPFNSVVRYIELDMVSVIRYQYKNCPQFFADHSHEAVIVETIGMVNNKTLYFGVQYWTPEMISNLQNDNGDGTVGSFVEKLFI